MKRHTLRVMALGAALLSAGAAPGQGQPKSGAAPTVSLPAPAQKEQKLARVATLDGIDANRDFQANVQLLQAQRQAAVELNAQMEKETDATKKADLKKQLDELMTKLNENNDRMAKAYGFSLTRNYTMVIEKAHIYTFVTDEEAATIEKAEREQAEKAKKDTAKKKK